MLSVGVVNGWMHCHGKVQGKLHAVMNSYIEEWDWYTFRRAVRNTADMHLKSSRVRERDTTIYTDSEPGTLLTIEQQNISARKER